MLTLEIDGAWEPEDFIAVLQSMESLYYKAALRRRTFQDDLFFRPSILYRAASGSFEQTLDLQNQAFLAQARMLAAADDRLSIKRIEYASPGGIDLLGLGRVMEASEKILGRLLDFYADRHQRKERDEQAKLDTEIKRQNLRAIKIENARLLLELRREFRDEIDDQLLLLAVRDQDALANLMAEGKLIGVKRDLGDSDLPEGYGDW